MTINRTIKRGRDMAQYKVPEMRMLEIEALYRTSEPGKAISGKILLNPKYIMKIEDVQQDSRCALPGAKTIIYMSNGEVVISTAKRSTLAICLGTRTVRS